MSVESAKNQAIVEEVLEVVLWEIQNLKVIIKYSLNIINQFTEFNDFLYRLGKIPLYNMIVAITLFLANLIICAIILPVFFKSINKRFYWLDIIRFFPSFCCVMKEIMVCAFTAWVLFRDGT